MDFDVGTKQTDEKYFDFHHRHLLLPQGVQIVDFVYKAKDMNRRVECLVVSFAIHSKPGDICQLLKKETQATHIVKIRNGYFGRLDEELEFDRKDE